MSTSFAIAKQKALERLGQVSVTNDALYSSLKSKVTLLSDSVSALRDRIKSLLRQYTELVATSTDIAWSFHGLYESSGRPLEGASHAIVEVRKELRDETLTKQCEDCREKIVAELENWTEELNALHLRMGQREELRVVFDHYSRKLESLRSASNKYSSRSRPMPRKDAMRLDRNEKKLEAARRDYSTKNEACIEEMQAIWTKRFSSLDTVFVDLVESEHELAGMLFSIMKKCLEPVREALDSQAPKSTTLMIEAPGESSDPSEGPSRLEASQAASFRQVSRRQPRVTEPNENVFDMFPRSGGSVQVVGNGEAFSGSERSFQANQFAFSPTAPSDPFAAFTPQSWPASEQSMYPVVEKPSPPFDSRAVPQADLRSELLDEWPTSAH